MDLKKMLSTSGLGNIQKALLVVHTLGDASDVKSSAQVIRATQDALGTATHGMSATSTALKNGGVDAKVMQVQYNPSTLSIQANAEAIPFLHLQDNMEPGIPNQSQRPPMVVLSVELVFDAMNPKDAFMAEKFTSISIGGIAESAAGAAKNSMEPREGYTVQPQTDGLVAALLKPSTRLVTFRWADMAFTGHLVEVQASYTMFSVSGKPIRSKVQMNIAQQVESRTDMDYWDKVMNDVFEKKELEAGRSMSQKAGNLLNLNAF